MSAAIITISFRTMVAYLDLIIADVSGHNVGAALLMAETRTFIRPARANELSSAHSGLEALNRVFL